MAGSYVKINSILGKKRKKKKKDTSLITIQATVLKLYEIVCNRAEPKKTKSQPSRKIRKTVQFRC